VGDAKVLAIIVQFDYLANLVGLQFQGANYLIDKLASSFGDKRLHLVLCQVLGLPEPAGSGVFSGGVV
jgi:hypothetical protein